MNQTLKATDYYRYPSVQITYTFAAILAVELIFVLIHIILQLKKGSKNPFARGMLAAEIGYFLLQIYAKNQNN